MLTVDRNRIDLIGLLRTAKRTSLSANWLGPTNVPEMTNVFQEEVGA